jgi:hypothetical protein
MERRLWSANEIKKRKYPLQMINKVDLFGGAP